MRTTNWLDLGYSLNYIGYCQIDNMYTEFLMHITSIIWLCLIPYYTVISMALGR